MKDNDGILALLQDIKEMLFGLALLLAGIVLCLVGAAVNGGLGILLLCPPRLHPPRSCGKTRLNGGFHVF